MRSKERKAEGKPTAKQFAFIEQYLVDLNATQAAIRAGYSPKTAREQAARMLSKAHIQTEISARQSKRSTRIDITIDRIELELARIAFSDMAKFSKWGPDGVTLVDIEDLTEDETRAVSEVTEKVTDSGVSSSRHTSFKLHDKVRALELLMKRHGAPDRVELTGKDGGPIKTESGFSDAAADFLKRKVLGVKA